MTTPLSPTAMLDPTDRARAHRARRTAQHLGQQLMPITQALITDNDLDDMYTPEFLVDLDQALNTAVDLSNQLDAHQTRQAKSKPSPIRFAADAAGLDNVAWLPDAVKSGRIMTSTSDDTQALAEQPNAAEPSAPEPDGASEDGGGVKDCPHTFGWALERLNQGKRLTRSGWNGPGQFVILQAGYPGGIPINANTAKATGLPEGTVRRFRPYLMMSTADGSFVPWVASQTDLLADDWQVDKVTPLVEGLRLELEAKFGYPVSVQHVTSPHPHTAFHFTRQ